jgi:thiopeptide-type bacteriocin biosynthesis protein
MRSHTVSCAVTDESTKQASSRWWYVKLYHHPGAEGAATDHLLRACVAPLTSEWLAQNAIDGFFFLRYVDEGGHHLRLRAHLCDLSAATLLNARLREFLRHEPSPIRLASAIYEPEIDKYGGPGGMVLAEQHFFISSRLAIDCVRRTINRSALRMLIAAYTFDHLLALATLGGGRQQLLTSYRDYWAGVHAGITGEALSLPSISMASADWWRDVRRGDSRARAIATELVGAGFPAWERLTANILQQLAVLAATGQLTTHPATIVCNMAHTFHNRLGLSVSDEVIVAALLLTQS